ncbi:MAG: VOC family protein, partial [Acidimicrobiia bacterium]
MGVTRLNHAVLYVRDLEETVTFYRDMFGFEVVMSMPGAAFLQAPDSSNDHDLGLFEIGSGAGPSMAGRQTVGLYHLAWEVDTLSTLSEIADRLSQGGALVGATDHGTTKALYGRDPNGLEFEVCWLVPAELIDEETLGARSQLRHLDLETEKARYGADTRGGVGIS